MTTTAPLALPAIARRALLGSAATLTLGIGAAGRGSAQTRRIVSTIFGGKFEEEYRKAIVDPLRRDAAVFDQMVDEIAGSLLVVVAALRG